MLLKLLAENNFDCWLVVDKNIPYQQNIKTFPFAVIIIDVFRNTLTTLQLMMPKLLLILEEPLLEKVIVVK